MKQKDFPPGWDEERVRRVLAHYEGQMEAEAIAEDEAELDRRLDELEAEGPTGLSWDEVVRSGTLASGMQATCGWAP